MACLLLLPLLV
ncbi:hypothetical protein S40288_10408 [Stachybotrys chartarum IBT 40288]|nr:hypothetical protein S40288_10408 [Stachybotrys chartarum IBT 40288]